MILNASFPSTRWRNEGDQMTVAFNEKTFDGEQIILDTPVKDILTITLNDKSAPVARRERAAKVLAYYNAVANKPVPSELDRAGQLMVAESDACALWNSPEKYRIDPVKGLVIVDVPSAGATPVEPSAKNVTTPPPAPTTSSERQPTPTPVPAQTFSPAVPLPVLPVSDVEKQAIAGLRFDLDARFSPKAVAERVK